MKMFKEDEDKSFGKLNKLRFKTENRIWKMSIIDYIWINAFMIKTMSKLFFGQKPQDTVLGSNEKWNQCNEKT